jgi:ferric-dicitrate binding protein FerR (iron transport regulator)
VDREHEGIDWLVNMSDGSNVRDGRVGDQIEHVLREALRVPMLNAEALARIRTASEQEWRQASGSTQSRTTSRRALWASLAAAAAVLAFVTVWYIVPAANSTNFGLIARSNVGAANVRFQFVRQRALQAGDTVRTGDKLTAHGPVLISLSGGGTLRVAADTVLEITGAAQARLRRGQVYVDLPPGASAEQPFRIVTREGTIEHVGTAFEVLENDWIMRVRVREGRVLLHRDTEHIVANAGTELTAMPGTAVSRREIETYGRDWLWVAALAPDYEIEGRPLLGFLEWASRELGRPLKFSDSHAHDVAQRTILHGSVRGREPLDALASVLATTSLTYEIRGDTIWIQSGHGT